MPRNARATAVALTTGLTWMVLAGCQNPPQKTETVASPPPGHMENYPPAEPLIPPKPAAEAPEATMESSLQVIPDGPKTTLIYRPRRVRSEVLAQALKRFVSLDGDIEASQELNTLLISDLNDRIDTLKSMLEAMDQAEPQILVEARVIEVTLDNDFEFDLEHTFTQLAGAGQFVQGGSISLKTPGSTPLTDQGFELTVRPLATDSELLDLTLRILFKQGRAKILSAPNVMVKVGNPANIITGEEVPIFKSTVTGGTVQVSTDFKPVGVKLRVTPLRVTGENVELEIQPEVSAVTGFSVGPEGSSAPIIASRTTRTTLTLKNGQILSIAGLMRDEKRKDVHKIPGLGDLPYVGVLFQSIRDVDTKTQLVFLIRVHILKDGKPWTIRMHEPGKGMDGLDKVLEHNILGPEGVQGPDPLNRPKP